MNKLESENLTKAWIEEHSGSALKSAKGLGWAYLKLNELVENEPLSALLIIRGISEQNESPETAAVLAAGPLEDLLAKHGTLTVDRVIEFCNVSKSFRHLLGGVWQNSISDDIWEKLQRIPHEKW